LRCVKDRAPHEWKHRHELTDIDNAKRYGAYASYYATDGGPDTTDYHGETSSHAELDRLLDVYAAPSSRVLDVGCGAGFTTCRIGAKVAEAWGIDINADLLSAASARVTANALNNITLVEGNTTDRDAVTNLPDDYFDVAWSQRGPNINGPLTQKLRKGATFVQELVGNFDRYPLPEMLGRRVYAPYNFLGREALLSQYSEIGLYPVSVKDYFYDEYFRDSGHLAVNLSQSGIGDWRIPSDGSYKAERDKGLLDRYAQCYATERGVRVQRHRQVFVFRNTPVYHYPIETSHIQPPHPDAG
jgi:SAM-dependent methyltransferase